MQEHLDDAYVKQAQVEGWRSRAVYKLIEIDQRDKLIKPGMTVVDLGAAPGGWSQYVSRKLNGNGKIIALDILPIDPITDVDMILGDFTEQAIYDRLIKSLENNPVDLVISDMAPNLSGMKAVDQPRSMYLAELAFEMTKEILDKNGAFLVKVFQGEGFDQFMREMRGFFMKVVSRKPGASRSRSREVYLLGRGIR
ncbi:MAG: 23S rRNA (uridine(2552)-2'-O)-methyltransferase RlmE [Gammaproteobacteria bacterium]|nr:MAG: 23S rRNA (uridine(2552)-2'-O)-methyltransferase RlmE [Gammaproteobacteria bacterium]